MSQHPSDCEIWGSLQAGESEWEAEEPTRAGPMATAGTQGQQAEKPCCPASAPRWENSDSLLSSWQGTPAGTGSSLEPISGPSRCQHRMPTGPAEGHGGPGSHTVGVAATNSQAIRNSTALLPGEGSAITNKKEVLSISIIMAHTGMFSFRCLRKAGR